MKFFSILVAISLAALVSAVLPQTVTDAMNRVVAAIRDVYDHQDNINDILRAVTELSTANLNIPDATVIGNRLTRNFVHIGDSRQSAHSAASYFEYGRNYVQAAKYGIQTFNDAT